MAFMLADSWLRLPQAWLLGMFVAWLLVTVAILLAVGRRLLRGQRSMEAMARRVEGRVPRIGQRLDQSGPTFRGPQRTPIGRSVRRRSTRRPPQLDHVAFEPRRNQGAPLAAFCPLYANAARSGRVVGRFGIADRGGHVLRNRGCPTGARPRRDCWRPGGSSLRSGRSKSCRVTPGDAEVLLGESVEIAAEINNPKGTPHRASLFVIPEGGRQTSLPMTADEKRQRSGRTCHRSSSRSSTGWRSAIRKRRSTGSMCARSR